MTPVELLIGIILLLLAVPDLCQRTGRPALLYTVYLMVGLLIGPALSLDVRDLLMELGRFGFILLLFQIGLEIDLPPVKSLVTPAKLALKWSVVQFPFVMVFARLAGLDWHESFLAAAAINGCSVSMTFLAWRHFPAPTEENKKHLLLWMVAIEILAIIILTAGSTLLKHGFGVAFFGQFLLIGAVVGLISKYADRLTSSLARKLPSSMSLKGHYIVLFVFVVAAVGARFGLSEAKTAFFLGLFISRATHEGLALEHHLKPIGQHLLIPIFFVSLGAFVPVELLATRVGLYALLATCCCWPCATSCTATMCRAAASGAPSCWCARTSPSWRLPPTPCGMRTPIPAMSDGWC
jgi:Kef-type K+ transport system membrane component KefB